MDEFSGSEQYVGQARGWACARMCAAGLLVAVVIIAQQRGGAPAVVLEDDAVLHLPSLTCHAAY